MDFDKVRSLIDELAGLASPDKIAKAQDLVQQIQKAFPPSKEDLAAALSSTLGSSQEIRRKP